MSAKDYFHEAVKGGLIKDGWIITHDPLYLDFDNARIQIDLAGEKLIAAEQGLEKIAVEVKSFIGSSTIYEFYLAVGQCLSYRIALKAQQPERKLYLAVPTYTYEEFFRRPFAQQTIKESQIHLLVYEPNQEVILQWIS
ncbi:MAG: fatty-acid oxidation protein subunit alpha [Moorea sp. SIO1F2]|uniref:Fatty-acid oxidation protein subunit alpha n=1 Tax=Moorena bouillonii PNG TaxID=568701 RepID=A0A1U7N890_9CYAN|nr:MULTISPECIES: XisH family protein [Moorena]NEO23882.1 fatty-acid oxidation protein subunit alpha [Moorena sp. SIO4A5]NEQ61890.1 fatty-acid oxidation protein subunit alpha [Moorena sp. SIO4A1]NET82592.1 fatty-acid oxidation protein subunit alpha [Moorena sp. SIO1F2]OLT62161.1 fatty-acid oxidation protein subunit alpha [Moorena bouillonii PNG]